MINKNLAFILFLFSLQTLFAQDLVSLDTIKKSEIKVSFLDSLKSTYVNYKALDKTDDLWAKDLNNLEVYNDLIKDIETINPDTPVDFELPTEVFKERLRLLDEKSAFNIEYNVGLENIVKSFLKNRRRSYERLMGLSQYYFPIFEEAMAKHNIPLEIKYLAVVESALKPKAVSRMGATGLWQFMYHTGKQYNLNIDTYVDERSDVLKASDAAARYMKGMYTIFNDWDLVLASYNSGAGNVSKAIRRSGGLTNYWNIKKNLPRETQGYVPAFLATMYIFEYHKEHGIKPEKPLINHYQTDTIAIKKQMTFKQISDLLDIPESEIEYLNPSYKRNVVPGKTNTFNFLRLPVNKVALFTSNESKMYAYANYAFNKREKVIVKAKKVIDTTKFKGNTNTILAQANSKENTFAKTQYYKVKKGDNLSDIAQKYGVALSDMKRWNNIRSNTVQLGRKLKIQSNQEVVVLDISENEAVKKSVSKENKLEIVIEKPLVSKEYTVQPGDNLFSIARENKIAVADLKLRNNITEENNNVYTGDKLIIAGTKIQKEVLTETKTTYYTVKKGDNLFEIATSNKVAMTDLKEWNNLKDSDVRVGEKLKIISTTKEGIASITKNDKKLKTSKETSKTYTVKNGDSLFSISQKHNTTIAEIKKLNGGKVDNLQPGMKIKI
ncbi:LysM peptidoglycan-binding domain-containing protein [Flavobacterium sp.]|uniref:LysM peptidoglycan-binding domain-containing protein n=1 Tax=Flavobacterium sp. TaxID=239 RepID=UPI00286E16FD|nr:LysM peptidoglycan-binding domain-containing protein [Flavobacterium sp.]